jgi:hypothetical protein
MYACQLILEERGVTPEQVEANIQEWKSKLAGKPLDSLLNMVKYCQGDDLDPHQRAAYFELIADKAHEVHDKRQGMLMKLAKLTLWLDHEAVAEVNHHVTDALAYEHEELIHTIMFYTELLDRVMDARGGY